jgi:hypothetical protein
MEITWAEGALSLGVGIGLAAATGMRVFLPLLLLGVSARLDLLHVSTGFEWLGSTPSIVALSAATIIEIAAYYLPVVDNFLDMLAAPLSVFAGILATAAVVTDLPPLLRWGVAIVAGGGTAGVVQTTTSLVRLKSTAFTAGLGNFVLATLEWVGSLVASLLAILAPLIALLVVVAAIISIALLKRRRRHVPLSPRERRVGS